jgi:hypothetical protein
VPALQNFHELMNDNTVENVETGEDIMYVSKPWIQGTRLLVHVVNCVYVCECVYACARVCMCVCMCVSVYMRVHACMCACVHSLHNIYIY